MKRSYFKRKLTVPMKRTRLRIAGHSTTKELKDEIQALVRQIVIKRDKGCFLRHFKNRINPKYINCAWENKDGELILQAEHLHSRSNASSFSDTRLIVCCCVRHHLYYKKEFGDEYNDFAREFIGKENAELWQKVKQDRTAHKVDLKLEILALKQQLQNL